MNEIETFVELSFKEQLKFAEALIKTINAEKIFTGDTDFKISGIEVDEIGGGLIILIEHDDLINVSREATWTYSDEDGASFDFDSGYEADYANFLFKDTREAFKTLEAVIDGYKVSLEVDDVEEEEIIAVNEDSSTYEDSGIGDFEHFGFRGYDSHPYIQAEGTIVVGCDCALHLYVEPIV